MFMLKRHQGAALTARKHQTRAGISKGHSRPLRPYEAGGFSNGTPVPFSTADARVHADVTASLNSESPMWTMFHDARLPSVRSNRSLIPW